MVNKEKGSLDDLANGEKSETNEAQDSPNAEANNEMKLKNPKLIWSVSVPGPINQSIWVLQLSTR